MTALERLRQAAELLPPGVSVVVPREALLEVLGPVRGADTASASEMLTVRDVAVRLHRSPSTIRSWVERSEFDGAVKIKGRSWLIPAAAIPTFLKRQRAGGSSARTPDLGEWRRHRRAVS